MKSACVIKKMEVSNLKAQNKDDKIDLKSTYAKLSNAKMDKAALKVELSFNKKHVGNYERLQIERNTLKGERDAAVIELDFTKKYYIPFC